MTKKFVDSENSISRPDPKYRGVLRRIAQDQVCPFCEQSLAKYHRMPVRQADSWLVTDNMYPYKPSKVHRLLILRRHAEHITELREGEWLELFQIAKKETADLNIAGGTLIMRFGETKFTGGSVHHLHAHLVQSDPDSPDYNKAIGLVMRIG